MATLKSKLGLVLGIAVVSGAFLIAGAFGSLHYHDAKRALQLRAVEAARAAAAALDVAAHERLQTSADQGRPEHGDLAGRLARMAAASPDVARLYTVRADDGRPTSKTWSYVLASDDGPESWVLAEPAASLRSHAKRVLRTKKPAVDRAPSSGARGKVVTAYAPLLDEGGRAVAVVAAELSAAPLAAALARVYRYLAVALGLGLALAWGLAWTVGREAARPLLELKDALERVARGDLTRPLATPRTDEVGACYHAANGMMMAVRQGMHACYHMGKAEAQQALASLAQGQLLSGEDLEHPAVRAARYARAADVAGGDWAHVRVCGGRWLYLLCGDVAGRGMEPALVSAMVAGAFEGLVRDVEEGLRMPAVAAHGSTLARSGAVFGVADVCRRLHGVLRAVGRADRPMALFVMVLDLETGVLEYTAAGHTAARLVRAGDGDAPSAVRPLRARTGLVGIEGALERMDVRTDRLAPGDMVVVHSDGLLERRDGDGRQYGPRRLGKVLRDPAPRTAAALRDAIVADVGAFCGDVAPEDDVGLIVAQFVAPITAELEDEAPAELPQAS